MLSVAGQVLAADSGFPVGGARVVARLHLDVDETAVEEELGEATTTSAGSFELVPHPESIESRLAAHLASVDPAADVIVEVKDTDGVTLLDSVAAPVRNGRSEFLLELRPSESTIERVDVAERVRASEVRTVEDAVTRVFSDAGGEYGLAGWPIRARLSFLNQLREALRSTGAATAWAAEPLLDPSLRALPFDADAIARDGIAGAIGDAVTVVGKLDSRPDTSVRGYRDYLRRIYTQDDRDPDKLKELTRRFGQDFMTTDVTERPLSELLIQIVETVLRAPAPYGFAIAPSLIDPATDATAAAYYTAKTLSADGYLDHLVSLSGLDAAEFGRRFRLSLDRRDDASSTPVQINIGTLQGWYRDSFQAGPEPAPALYPATFAGQGPFFLEYTEWVLAQQPTFLANAYPLRACRLTDITDYHERRQKFATLQKGQEGYDDVRWVLQLAEIDDELDRGHASYAQGQYVDARNHYLLADRLIRERVPLFTPTVAHATFFQTHRNYLRRDTRSSLWPVVGNEIREKTGGPNVEPDEWLGAYVTRQGYEAASIYIQCCCIPVFLGDVYLAMGSYAEANREYGRVTRFLVGAADFSSTPGWPLGPVHGGLYWDGSLPYTSATSSDNAALAEAGASSGEPLLATWLIPAKLSQIEQEFFSLRHGECLLEWADALYRSDDAASIERARELYKAVLWLWGEDPPYVAHWDYRFSPHWPQWVENPAVTGQKTRASLRLGQIDAELNWFGYSRNTVPPLRYSALREAARGMNALARSAEQDLLAYLARIEEEWIETRRAQTATQRAQLQRKVAVQQAAISADALVQAKYQFTLAEQAVAGKEAEIADHESLVGQFTDFFEGWKGALGLANDLPDDQKRAAGEALLSSTFEGDGLYGLGAGPTVMLGYVVVTGVSVSIIESMGNADSARRGQLIFLKDRMIPAAEAGVDAKTREQAIAALQEQIVDCDAALADDLLRFESVRTLSIDFFAAMATLRRRMMRRYLDLAARYSWLAQRALAFDLDRDIDLVRLDYWPAPMQGLTGTDLLEADLAELEAVRLDAATETVPVRYTASLAREFPLAFGHLRRTGSCVIHTTEETLRRAHPGLYGYRTRAVTIQPQALVVSTAPRGLLSNAGVSTISRSDGSTHVLARPDDATAVSEFRLERDMTLYGLPGEALLAFEGSGYETIWRLELPLDANLPDLDSLIDVLLTFDLEARYSPTLAEIHRASAPTATARIAVAAASSIDSKALSQLRANAGAVAIHFPFDALRLPANESNRTVTNVGILVCGARPESATLQLRAGAVSATVRLKNGFALSDAPPLAPQTPRSPLLPFVGVSVDQTFTVTIDPAKNVGIDFSHVNDVLLILDYTATT
jgi:hypothetical protein